MAKRKITDEQLRAELNSGASVPEIAEKYGISRQTLYGRCQGLNLTTADRVLNGPTEAQRYVNASLNVLEQLDRGCRMVNKLMDAYSEWLTDAENPDKYDIGPRSSEVMVTYTEFFD